MRAQPSRTHFACHADDLHCILEELKPQLRIAVIFGGNKRDAGSVLYEAQNSRSWKSYEGVAEDIAASLRRVGFANVQLMPDDMALGDRLRRAASISG